MDGKMELIKELIEEHLWVKDHQIDKIADVLFDYYGSEDDDVLETIVSDAIREIDFDRYVDNVVEDYAYELMNEIYQIPEYLESYIDYEKFARDLQLGGDIAVIGDKDVTIIIDNLAF